MKYLIAILEQERLGEVVQGIRVRLGSGDGRRITVSDVVCHNDSDTPAPLYRGHRQAGAPLPRIRLEMILDEDEVVPVIDAIAPAGDSRQKAPGDLVVLELASCFSPAPANAGLL